MEKEIIAILDCYNENGWHQIKEPVKNPRDIERLIYYYESEFLDVVTVECEPLNINQISTSYFLEELNA